LDGHAAPVFSACLSLCCWRHSGDHGDCETSTNLTALWPHLGLRVEVEVSIAHDKQFQHEQTLILNLPELRAGMLVATQ